MNRIKEFRTKRGLRQKDVAKMIGVSVPSISYYERGKKKPSINNALKIAQVLDTTIEDLFIFESKKT